MKEGYVYTMSSVTHTIYIGVTSDLERRVWQHQHGEIEGFTTRYDLDRLVYYESCGDIRGAIEREKQLKGWRREKKNALIESLNPTWEDLAPGLFEQCPREVGCERGHPERSVAKSKDWERGSALDSRSLDKLGMTVGVLGMIVEVLGMTPVTAIRAIT
jgi:putative endonuclease